MEASSNTSSKNIKRVKKSITEIEYKKLMSFTRGNEDIKPFNQKRFLKIFSL
jgi:integrase/recombinase XerD